MPVATFPCACCEASIHCCRCSDCCFSDNSQVVLTWSIAGRDPALASACHCPEPATQGSLTLAFEFCDQQMTRWAASTCQQADPCGDFQVWQRARVWRDCNTGRWHAQVDAMRNDGPHDPPCDAVGVIVCSLWQGNTDQGNCCGTQPVVSPFAMGCCHLGGQVSVTWSIEVIDNACCKDPDSNCQPGEPDCQGDCDQEDLP